MFKILSTKEYERLKALETRSSKHSRDYLRLVEQLEEAVHTASDVAAQLTVATSKLAEANTVIEKMNNSTINEVCIRISNDIEQITPVIRYRPDCFEGLFQAGFLNDTQEGNQAAIQLALLAVAHEGIGQILESFEAIPED